MRKSNELLWKIVTVVITILIIYAIISLFKRNRYEGFAEECKDLDPDCVRILKNKDSPSCNNGNYWADNKCKKTCGKCGDTSSQDIKPSDYVMYGFWMEPPKPVEKIAKDKNGKIYYAAQDHKSRLVGISDGPVGGNGWYYFGNVNDFNPDNINNYTKAAQWSYTVKPVNDLLNCEDEERFGKCSDSKNLGYCETSNTGLYRVDCRKTCGKCDYVKKSSLCPPEKNCPPEKTCPPEKVCPTCPPEKVCPKCAACPVCPSIKSPSKKTPSKKSSSKKSPSKKSPNKKKK